MLKHSLIVLAAIAAMTQTSIAAAEMKILGDVSNVGHIQTKNKWKAARYIPYKGCSWGAGGTASNSSSTS